MNDRDAALAATAEAQHGVWTHAQAAELGMGRSLIHHRMATGRWVRMLPGVFRHASTPVSWLMQVHASVLWGGEGAVASHRTAAALWGFDGFPRAEVELSIQSTRRISSPGVTVHRREPLDPADLTRSWGIPVTRPPRTVVDLAAVIEDSDGLEAAVDAALRSGKLSASMLERVLARVRRTRHPGVGRLDRVLERRRGTLVRTDSPAETRLLRVLASGGLPLPECRYEVKAGRELVARIDLAYPDAKLAIEYDGYRYHSSRLAWAKDTSRANELVSRGWRVLRFTAEDLRRPEAVCASVREALGGVARRARSRG